MERLDVRAWAKRPDWPEGATMITTKQRPADRPASVSPAKPDCGCGGKDATPRSRVNHCVPCDLDRFCRNHYFTGKLLTARDLTLEQRYFRDKLRLHHRILHGWGVACGLLVKPHPYCPDRRLIVEPGVAIDKCGYEIVVPAPVEIELPQVAKNARPASPCPPEQDGGYGRGDEHDHKHAHAHEHERKGERPYQRGYGERRGAEQDDSRRDEPRYGSPKQPENPYPSKPPAPCVPLSICLRYAECEEDFGPAPFDECGCNGSERRQANRVCEGYVLEFRFEEPPRVDRCDEQDTDLCARLLEPCAQPEQADCIPLAYIEDYRPGETIVDERINNQDYRPLLASTRVLERALQCLLEHAPHHSLTRVQDYDWTHAQEYRCHDFLKFFTGEKPGDGAFDVTFSHPVRTDALNRVFQAVIVRHRGAGPAGPLELAPARAWTSDDRTRLFLQIDRSWAERELDNTRFDVYLTLRCSLIIDDNGRAVDGELLARLVEDDKYLVAPPTGNGMPGGTLESWILVRP
jgi:hypothetical protein